MGFETLIFSIENLKLERGALGFSILQISKFELASVIKYSSTASFG